MSLGARLAIILSCLFLVSSVILGVFQYESFRIALIKEIDETLALRAEALLTEIAPLMQEGIDERELAHLHLNPTPLEDSSAAEVFVQIDDPEGNVLASSDNLHGIVLPGKLFGSGESFETVKWVKDCDIRILSVPVVIKGKPAATLVLGESLHLVNASLKRVAHLMVISEIITLIITLLATFAVLSWSLSPLRKVAHTAEIIKKTGDVSRRVPVPRSSDVVGQVAVAFNSVVTRVEELLKSQAQLLADTSHELRNPLTVIRTDLDLLKRELDKESREEISTEAEKEVERMARLVDELTLLSMADSTLLIDMEPVRLNTLANEIGGRMRSIIGRRVLEINAKADPVVKGDSDRICQVLRNLLENAIRYTPEEGKILVEIWQKGNKAYLAVEDNGIGIPEEHLPRIFERFYRVDKARSRASGGTGLGLTIAKTLVKAHNGTIEVTSEPGRGSRFIISLPAEPSWSYE